MSVSNDTSSTEYNPTRTITSSSLITKETTRKQSERKYSKIQIELDILEVELSINICNKQLKCLKKMNRCISKSSDHQFDTNKFQIIQEIVKYDFSKRKLKKELKKLKRIRRKLRWHSF